MLDLKAVLCTSSSTRKRGRTVCCSGSRVSPAASRASQQPALATRTAESLFGQRDEPGQGQPHALRHSPEGHWPQAAAGPVPGPGVAWTPCCGDWPATDQHSHTLRWTCSEASHHLLYLDSDGCMPKAAAVEFYPVTHGPDAGDVGKSLCRALYWRRRAAPCWHLHRESAQTPWP